MLTTLPVNFDGPTLRTLQHLRDDMPQTSSGASPGIGLAIRALIEAHPDASRVLEHFRARGRAAHLRNGPNNPGPLRAQTGGE